MGSAQQEELDRHIVLRVVAMAPPAASSTRSIEDLLAHAAWLNRLARYLLHDDEAAADAVQEVWLSAGRAPPDRKRPARPWLAQVLRNVVRMRMRIDGRRQRWEDEAARDQALAPASNSSEVLYERLELHRALVEAVLKLDEPLRSTVLLRFFEERSSSEIAAAMSVPDGTVRWRLKSAVERLRADLDTRFGGERRRWAIALAPLTRLPSLSGGAAWTGGLIMAKGKLSLAAATAILLLLLGGGVWLARRPLLALLGAGAGGPGAGAAGVTPKGREPWSGWSLPPTNNDAAGTGRLAGTVHAPDARIVAAARIVVVRAVPGVAASAFPPVEAEAATDAAGGFAVDRLPPGVYHVVAMAEGWAPARRSGIAVEAGSTARADLALARGGAALGGRITDVGGGPIPGALVTAVAALLHDGTPRPLVLRALSNEHGVYRLFSRTGPHQVRIEASGYARIETFVQLNDNLARDFELSPAAQVGGHVRDRRSGQPVADAEVQLLRGDDGFTRQLLAAPVRTNEEGAFRIVGVDPGRYTALARRGLLASSGVDVTAKAAVLTSVEILVDPAASVSGRVLDDDGRPVGGVLAQLSWRGFAAQIVLRTRSDAQGRYRIEGVLPGLYTARAFLEPFPSLHGKQLTVGTTDLTDVDLRVEQPAVLEGNVLTTAGGPAGNVDVSVTSAVRRPGAMMAAGGDTVTDEAGRFRATVTPGKVSVRAHDPGGGQAATELDAVRSGETRRLDLRLRDGGNARISGHVRWDDGRPAAGVLVVAYAQQLQSHTRADAEGRFDLTRLDGGSVRVEARVDEDSRYRGSWNQAEMQIQLGPGEHRQDLVLMLTGRGSIAGGVLSPDGSAAAGVIVVAALERDGRAYLSTSRRGASRDDGGFEIADLPKGNHTVLALHEAYPDAEVAGVSVGRTDVVVRFRRGGTLAGVVVGDSGRPAPDYFITAVSKNAGAIRRRPSQQIHDPQGAFRFDRLPPGSYALEATTPTGQRAGLQVAVAEGEANLGLRLSLHAPATLFGRAVDFDTGEPVVDVVGTITLPMGVASATSDARGAFSFAGLPPGGRLEARFTATGYVTGDVTLEIPNTASSESAGPPLTIRMLKGRDDNPGPRLGSTGLVLDSDGQTYRVARVRPGSPAAEAGAAAGEILIAVNGKPVDGLGRMPLLGRLLVGDPGTRLGVRLRSTDGRVRDLTLSLVPTARP